MKIKPQDSSSRGFTLIEILIVILIIAILSSLVIAAAKAVQNKGRKSRAEGEIEAISTALECYKADNGDYPAGSNSSVLVQTLMPTNRTKVYYEFRSKSIDSNNNLIDPWGSTNRYFYQYPGSSNRSGTNFYDLWTIAGDTTGTNTNSWIKNW